MKRKTLWMTLLPVIMFSMIQCNMKETSNDNEKLINEIIASLTLEQKAQYVVGTGMYLDLPKSEEV